MHNQRSNWEAKMQMKDKHKVFIFGCGQYIKYTYNKTKEHSGQ